MGVFFNIMFYVYILYSSKIDRYYIGYSENPEKRLLEKHNLGYVKSTKIGVPYILKSKKLFQTEIEAIQEERRFIQTMNKCKKGNLIILILKFFKHLNSNFRNLNI